VIGAGSSIKKFFVKWRRQALVGLVVGLAAFVGIFPEAFTDPGETREVVLAIVAGSLAIYFAARASAHLWPDKGILAGDRLLGKLLGRPRHRPRPKSAVAASMRSIPLTKFQLTEVDLRGATLPGANLVATDLTGAKLRGADLSGAKMRLTNLHNADLRGSDLRFAGLSHSSLTGARLDEALLDRADLRGADLSETDLEGASLRGAIYDGDTLWPRGQNPKVLGAENVEDLDPR
jgi:hypothetical protein